MQPPMRDDLSGDLAAMKEDLTRNLSAQVETLVNRFVDAQACRLETFSRQQEHEQARLLLRQQQLEDRERDVERFVLEEIQQLRSRFGEAWPVEEPADVAPLARLQLAWRQGVRLFEGQLLQVQQEAQRQAHDAEQAHHEALAAKDQEIERMARELAASEERKLASEGSLVEEKQSVERQLQRRSMELDQALQAKSEQEQLRMQDEKQREETQQALSATEYDRQCLQEQLAKAQRERDELETRLFSQEASARTTEQELRDLVAKRERKVADVQRAMQEQETELLQKIERVQQYMRERQAGALQAEKMQAVAQHDSGKAAAELRRIAADRDRVTSLLMAAEEKLQKQQAEYEQKLARAEARQRELGAQVSSLEKENRDKNHEVLVRREQDHQQQVTRERLREQERAQALVRRKEQELLVKDAKLQSLRQRVEELEQR